MGIFQKTLSHFLALLAPNRKINHVLEQNIVVGSLFCGLLIFSVHSLAINHSSRILARHSKGIYLEYCFSFYQTLQRCSIVHFYWLDVTFTFKCLPSVNQDPSKHQEVSSTPEMKVNKMIVVFGDLLGTIKR